MGPMFTPLRVPGHTLYAEGSVPGRQFLLHPTIGPALCSCGWLSDVIETRAARKRAHRAHKADVLQARAT